MGYMKMKFNPIVSDFDIDAKCTNGHIVTLLTVHIHLDRMVNKSNMLTVLLRPWYILNCGCEGHSLHIREEGETIVSVN